MSYPFRFPEEEPPPRPDFKFSITTRSRAVSNVSAISQKASIVANKSWKGVKSFVRKYKNRLIMGYMVDKAWVERKVVRKVLRKGKKGGQDGVAGEADAGGGDLGAGIVGDRDEDSGGEDGDKTKGRAEEPNYVPIYTETGWDGDPLSPPGWDDGPRVRYSDRYLGFR